jgi:hypothetical protein
VTSIATSAVLQRLRDQALADCFTLGWLMGRLRGRSFGIIMLLLALLVIAPGIAMVAGLLLMIPAFQMIAGRPGTVFPHGIAARRLPTRSGPEKMDSRTRRRWPTSCLCVAPSRDPQHHNH